MTCLLYTSNSFDRDEQVELPPRSGVLVHPFFLSTLKQAIEGISGVSNVEAADHDKVLEGKHFLAAEDNLMNASILEELLDMEGATVEIVENGQLLSLIHIYSRPSIFPSSFATSARSFTFRTSSVSFV